MPHRASLKYCAGLLIAAGALAPLPAPAFVSCIANKEEARLVDGSHLARTWTPLAPGGTGDAFHTLRTTLGLAGFTLVGEERTEHGGALHATHGSPGWRNLQVRFDVDQTLGAVSASATFARVGHGDLSIEGAVCALFEATFPSGDQLPGTLSLFGRKGKAAEALTAAISARPALDRDRLYTRALAQGQAVVIVPVLNVDAKYLGKGSEQAPAELWADLSSETRWTREGGEGQILVGHHGGVVHAGLRGFQHSFVADNARYLVYIVQPGRYGVDGTTVELKQTALPDIAAGNPADVAGVGSVYLEPSKYTEYYRTEEWRDALYSERDVSTSYCAMALVSGACVQWGRVTGTVRDQVSGAGYHQAVKSYAADLLRVTTTLGRPFAGFTVGAGEVVVIDGLYAQHPSIRYDTGNCMTEGKGVRCAITDFVLVRIPGKLDDLRSPGALRASGESPVLRGLLGRATYRPLDVVADGGLLAPGLGQVYAIGPK